MPSELQRQAVRRVVEHIPIRAAAEAALLQTALTHRSWANETAVQQGETVVANERLEFLGDSVLGLVIANELYRRLPESDEGLLSKAKARLVSAAVLARHARSLELGKAVLLGRGEDQTGGRDRVSILANVLEAVIGAVFLEEGMDTAERFILDLWRDELDHLEAGQEGFDARSRLQEYCQKQFGNLPVYRLERTTGPDHDRRYEIAVEISGKVAGWGMGHSKKQAAQIAAAEAWAKLRKEQA